MSTEQIRFCDPQQRFPLVRRVLLMLDGDAAGRRAMAHCSHKQLKKPDHHHDGLLGGGGGVMKVPDVFCRTYNLE